MIINIIIVVTTAIVKTKTNHLVDDQVSILIPVTIYINSIHFQLELMRTVYKNIQFTPTAFT